MIHASSAKVLTLSETDPVRSPRPAVCTALLAAGCGLLTQPQVVVVTATPPPATQTPYVLVVTATPPPAAPTQPLPPTQALPPTQPSPTLLALATPFLPAATVPAIVVRDA